MAQLTDDCFAAGGPLMTLGSALDLLLAKLVTVTESERLPLAGCVGRILAAPVTATVDVPPHDNSAVDGYAVYKQLAGAKGLGEAVTLAFTDTESNARFTGIAVRGKGIGSAIGAAIIALSAPRVRRASRASDIRRRRGCRG